MTGSEGGRWLHGVSGSSVSPPGPVFPAASELGPGRAHRGPLAGGQAASRGWTRQGQRPRAASRGSPAWGRRPHTCLGSSAGCPCPPGFRARPRGRLRPGLQMRPPRSRASRDAHQAVRFCGNRARPATPQLGTVPFPGRARPAAATPSRVPGRPVAPTHQWARTPNLSFGLHSGVCLNLYGFD